MFGNLVKTFGLHYLKLELFVQGHKLFRMMQNSMHLSEPNAHKSRDPSHRHGGVTNYNFPLKTNFFHCSPLVPQTAPISFKSFGN